MSLWAWRTSQGEYCVELCIRDTMPKPLDAQGRWVELIEADEVHDRLFAAALGGMCARPWGPSHNVVAREAFNMADEAMRVRRET